MYYNYMSRPRSHRLLKWIGIVTCALILTVGLLSLRWAVRWRAASSDFGISVRGGAVFLWQDTGLFQGTVNYIPWRASGRNVGPLSFERASGPNRCTARISIGTGFHWAHPASSAMRTNRYVAIPLWMPFAALAMPTALLWWHDRRRLPPGECQQCGYDLTGNVSGRCPECGEPTLVRGGRVQG